MGKCERVDRQHELPSIADGRCLAQRFQIGAVEDVDAQNRLDEIVNGIPKEVAFRPWRVTCGFPDDQRDIALFQPGKDRIIEPRGTFFGAELGSPTIAAPAKHKCIPCLSGRL